MQQRWYDKDPTLSMAMSLLQNASLAHQEMAARYMFNLMRDQGLLDAAELRTSEERIRFIFPAFRRSRFEMHARHLVELLKHLSFEAQQDLAMQLINYIYLLDGGMTEFSLPVMSDEHEDIYAQPESG
ncbi:MAG TPA: hypothetical protein V6C52_13725 [Coleofasciculaceae cyanobacterium]|jgi:hypothetical protein